MKEQTISVVIAVKNEEHNIAECLESVKWVDEIIVVDHYSSDKTVEIAKRYTSKVYYGDGGPLGLADYNKNIGIKKAKGEWVLIVDADERSIKALKAEILEAIKKKTVAAYKIHFKCYFISCWLNGPFYNEMYNIRLFRNGAGLFPCNNNHEQIMINGAVGILKEPLVHKWCNSYKELFEKMRRYAKQDACGLAFYYGTSLTKKKKEDVGIYTLFFEPLLYIFYLYFYKKNYKDRMQGAIISIAGGYYLFLTYWIFIWLKISKVRLLVSKNEKCICCYGALFRKAMQGHVDGQKFKVIQCWNCGLGRIESIQHVNYETYNIKFYVENQNLFKKYMGEILDYASLYKKEGRLLDVGANIGLLVHLANQRGFDAEGMEMSKEAIKFGRAAFGIKYYEIKEDFNKNKVYFDVVTMNHVLEHIKAPRDFLKQISKVMRKRAIIVIAVPNFASISAKIFRTKWTGLQPQEHLWLFTPTALQKLLQSEGFVIKKVVINEPYRQYKWKIRSMVRLLLCGPFYFLSDTLRQGRNLIIIAEKHNEKK
ncbi:MAG: methyltransferase domain-containing protein [Nanoarchaeota archaeon]